MSVCHVSLLYNLLPIGVGPGIFDKRSNWYFMLLFLLSVIYKISVRTNNSCSILFVILNSPIKFFNVILNSCKHNLSSIINRNFSPRGCSYFHCFRIELEFGNFGFVEGDTGKLEYVLGEKPSVH